MIKPPLLGLYVRPPPEPPAAAVTNPSMICLDWASCEDCNAEAGHIKPVCRSTRTSTAPGGQAGSCRQPELPNEPG